MAKTLYIIATPIGNLEDITLRALKTLEQADAVMAEDTRRSIKLLNHYGIKKPMISLNKHNEIERSGLVLEMLSEGKDVALVSDAGTPCISDPGTRVVHAVREAGFEVVPLPGACAFVTAISGCGEEMGQFIFEGFLPQKGSQRTKRLERIAGYSLPFILYEAPHHLKKTLSDLYETLGERELTIARELTKVYEEIVRTTLSEAMERYEEPKGEFVLMIQPKESGEDQARADALMQAAEEMAKRMAAGERRKDAAAAIAQKYNLKKNEVYQMGLE